MRTTPLKVLGKISAADVLARLKGDWLRGENPVRDIAVLRHRWHDVLNAAGSDVFAAFDLTLSQMETLFTLRASPRPHRLTPQELTRSILITGGGMTKVLRELESRGLIRCASNKADGRSKHVLLTPAGKTIAEKALPRLLATEGELLRSALSASELAALARLLGKVVGRLESARPSERVAT